MDFKVMCKKANWLQKLWKPKEGDKFLVNETGEIHFNINTLNIDIGNVSCVSLQWCGLVRSSFPKRDVTWLPNSDDLFELLPVNYDVHRIYVSADKMRCFARKPVVPVWQIETFFGSTAKEALLQAVAFELYNFTWEDDIEEWVNLPTKPIAEKQDGGLKDEKVIA